MLNEKVLLQTLKRDFDHIKEYTDTSIKESLPCYKKYTSIILRGKDNDFILSDGRGEYYYNTDDVFDLDKNYTLVINGNEYILYQGIIEDTNIYYCVDEYNGIYFIIALNVIIDSDGNTIPSEGKVLIFANKPYSFQIYETDIKYLDNGLLQDNVYIKNTLNINNEFLFGNGATFNKNVISNVYPTDSCHLVNKLYVDNNLPCRYINKKYIKSMSNNTANRELFNIEGTGYHNIGLHGAITIDETKDYSLYSYGFNRKEIPLTKVYDNSNILSLRCYFYGGELTITPKGNYTWFYYSKIIDEKITLDYDLTIYEYEQLSKLNPIFLDDNLTASNSISVGRTIADGNIGDFSFACGKGVIASGSQSQAMGQNVKAIALGSHAEGGSTIAEGIYSHAEGCYTTASGNYGSHSEGEYTKATGESSHAEGRNTIASSNFQHVQGQYNIEDTENKYAHIVGNGSYSARSNAHTLDWQGNAWYQGKLSQDGTPTEDKDLTTKKYVDDKIIENNDLVVNFTVSYNFDTKTFDYSCDHTYEQIVSAIEAGKEVRYDNSTAIYITEDSTNRICFTDIFDSTITHYTINPDNTIERLYKNLLELDNVKQETGTATKFPMSQKATTDAINTSLDESKSYTDTKVASLVNSAPETLDTLKELSTALGDDPNFATTMTNTLAGKVDKIDGKSLVLNSEIARLAKLDNYDDTEVRSLITTKADSSSIPTKVSQLTNDSGYLTAVPDTYATQSYVTDAINKAQLDSSQSEIDLDAYALKSDVELKANKTELHEHTNKSLLDNLTIEDFKAVQELTESLNGPKNLYNPDTDNIGKYLNNSGGLYDNASYITTDYIPIIPGQTLYFYASRDINIKCGARFVAFYDASRQHISELFINDGMSSTYNVTASQENVAYIRISFFTNGEKIGYIENVTPGIELKYGEQLSNSSIWGKPNKVDVFLPDDIYCAVDRTIELYNNQVCLQADKLHINWVCDYGHAMKRKFSITGTSALAGNSIPLTLEIYDDYMELLYTQTTDIHIISNVLTENKTCVSIGDSWTNQKPWMPEVINLSNEKISFVGKFSYTGKDADGNYRTCSHEGRSGFSAYDYDRAAPYTFGGADETQYHAFWNPTTSRFDWNYYVENILGGTQPDMVILQMGINGIVYDNTSMVSHEVNMINYIRQDNVDIPIFICIPAYKGNQNGLGVQTSNDGFASNKGCYDYGERQKVMDYITKLYKSCKNMVGVYFIPQTICFDSEYNYGAVDTPVNPRATIIEKLPVEAVHPQDYGYYQMADIVYSTFCAVI